MFYNVGIAKNAYLVGNMSAKAANTSVYQNYNSRDTVKLTFKGAYEAKADKDNVQSMSMEEVLDVINKIELTPLIKEGEVKIPEEITPAYVDHLCELEGASFTMMRVCPDEVLSGYKKVLAGSIAALKIIPESEHFPVKDKGLYFANALENTSWAARGLGELYEEYGDTDEDTDLAQKAKELGEKLSALGLSFATWQGEHRKA